MTKHTLTGAAAAAGRSYHLANNIAGKDTCARTLFGRTTAGQDAFTDLCIVHCVHASSLPAINIILHKLRVTMQMISIKQ